MEALVGQLERDKALARAMKSCVQLQQFLAMEAESTFNDAEKGSHGSDSPSGNGSGATTGTTRKGMKKMMAQPQEIATLLDEFRQMEYAEDEDSVPQDIFQLSNFHFISCNNGYDISLNTSPNSNIMVVHNIHLAAQQALFCGKISKSIQGLTNNLAESDGSSESEHMRKDLVEKIKREADRRNADMQGWVGEWVSQLGKLAQLVTARNPPAGSASYANLQKEFEVSNNKKNKNNDLLIIINASVTLFICLEINIKK